MEPTNTKWGLILRYMKGLWYLLAISLLASVLSILLDFLTPQVIRITVDSIIGTEPFRLPAFLLGTIDQAALREALRTNLWWCVWVVLGISVAAGLFMYLRRTSITKGGERFIQRLRDALFAHIQRLPYQWHMEHQKGDIIQRCTSDVETVYRFLIHQMIELIRTVFLVVFSIAIMFSMNVKMTLVSLAFIPLVIAYSKIYYSKIAVRFRRADESEGELSSAVQENLTGVRVVRAFGRERYEVERFDEKNEYFTGYWIHLGKLLGSYWGIGDLLTGLQIVSVILLGVVEAVNGSITLGEFLVFVSYNAQLVWPIRGVGRILSELSKASISVDRINDILKAQPEQDPANALTPPMSGDIVFDHVTFAYENAPPVLKDVSFTIKGGTTIGILGGTGSGKSTLVHLLDRLYDLPEGSGTISIGGVDIRTMERGWVRRHVGMVLQEPFLFSRTIQSNISAFRPDAPAHDVRRAADIACVDETVAGFADGYDTMIGERGVTLSGGQRQRVAIARMLMQRAPIMVFDDSLSAVDAETDANIRSALNKHLGGSTVILISHRITSLMEADCILVLEQGRVAQMGTHRQLIAREGLYKSIYDIQKSGADC